MKRVGLFLIVLLIAACGGGGQKEVGQVAGQIYDANGDPVRGARVWTDTNGRRETVSNSTGAYVLTDVGEGDIYVQAEVDAGGARFIGQNVARIFGGERTKSTNIAVYRDNQLAGIEGYIRDRFGNLIGGARIFAASGNSLSGAMAISDDEGYFFLGRLQSGVNYDVVASGRGYDSDSDRVFLDPDEVRRADFILGDGGDPLLPPPNIVSAQAWTTPAEEVTNRTAVQQTLPNVKRLWNKRNPLFGSSRTPKLSLGGNNIEVDLAFDFNYNDSLLGFGIYRGRTTNGQLTGIDFLRDPLTRFYQDMDEDLIESTNYYYEVTALNVLYPDTPDSESDPSNRYGVRTLGDLELRSVVQTPLTFRWQAANGADQYVVYLFDEYPNLGVDPIWDSTNNRTSNTQLVYNGPSLTRDRGYFYLVVGVANNDESLTVSRVGEFVKN
ncbi:MAG TPA: carboxypeptidase-like regulatory domain-containing protein [Fimbriimonadaceae bacterium]|nr:carboxypeptidase-like regulatory domain-containing protein [Fimbriimonadaceae bacterium]